LLSPTEKKIFLTSLNLVMQKVAFAVLLCLLLVCASAFAKISAPKTQAKRDIESIDLTLPEIVRDENPAERSVELQESKKDVVITEDIEAEWWGWIKDIKKLERSTRAAAIAAAVLAGIAAFLVALLIVIFLLYWWCFSGNLKPRRPAV
jgi:hypothetical protein